MGGFMVRLLSVITRRVCLTAAVVFVFAAVADNGFSVTTAAGLIADDAERASAVGQYDLKWDCVPVSRGGAFHFCGDCS